MPDNTILLHGPENQNEVVKEVEADATITPGETVELSSLGTAGATTERRYSLLDTDGFRPRSIALEHSQAGRGIDDDYSDGDHMFIALLAPGMEVRGFVFDGSNAAGTGTDLSANANISAGDYVVGYSGAGVAGALRAYVDGTDDVGAILGQATESVDNSAGGTAARIDVEVQ